MPPPSEVSLLSQSTNGTAASNSNPSLLHRIMVSGKDSTIVAIALPIFSGCIVAPGLYLTITADTWGYRITNILFLTGSAGFFSLATLHLAQHLYKKCALGQWFRKYRWPIRLPKKDGVVYNTVLQAQVVKLVDTPDLGSGAARCGGSSPLLGIHHSSHENPGII